jgi:hypothetical protein
MSSRPGIVASIRNPTENAGVSPNAFVAEVTAELRMYWPPLATDAELEAAFVECVNLARFLIIGRRIELNGGTK